MADHELKQGLDGISEKVRRAAQGTQPPQKLATFLDEAIERIERRHQGLETPIETPWPELNAQLGGGLWPGLHTLVGGTGTGKTQLALQCGLKAAEQGVPVLYIGLELERFAIACRLLALLASRLRMKRETRSAQIFWSAIYRGKLSRDDRSWLDQARKTLTELPIHTEFGEASGWSYDRLDELAHSMRNAYPEQRSSDGCPIAGSQPFLVVLDFLQFVCDPQGEYLDLRQRIGRAAYAGRQIARDHGASVLFISSTARACYALREAFSQARPYIIATQMGSQRVLRNPDPLVGLGKESGEIEYACDSITVAARLSSDAVSGDGHRPVIFATSKLRAGSESWCALDFVGGNRFISFANPDATARDILARGVRKTPGKKNGKPHVMEKRSGYELPPR